MFANRHKLDGLLTDISKALDRLDRRVEKMETVLMVREPSSVAAAEAYEGLRKQVVNAVSERLSHLAQLVQFDEAVSHDADRATLAKLVDSWLDQASLTRVTDGDDARRDAWFELVADHGGAFEVLEPAYVDAVTGRVIRLGRARRVATAEHSAEPSAEPAGEAGGAA